MNHINLDKFLTENPPSYGVLSRKEIEKSAKKKIKILIILYSVLAIVYLLLMSFGEIYTFIMSILLFLLLFLFGGGLLLLITNYEIFKSVPRMQLEQFARFVNAFEPESWACGEKYFIKFLVMKSNRNIYAFFFGSSGKLLKCDDVEERPISVKDRARIMLGRVENDKQLIEKFRLEGYKFRVYHVNSTILPHPVKEDAVVHCKSCIEITWSSWIFPPLYINPNVLVNVLKKYSQ
jgi:hypothetical protein